MSGFRVTYVSPNGLLHSLDFKNCDNAWDFFNFIRKRNDTIESTLIYL